VSDPGGSLPREGQPAWEGRAYRPFAAHHRSYDDWFLARHAPDPGHDVVDAGCGTGEFTSRLAELVVEGSVVGIEPDPSMLAEAEARAGGNLRFRAGRLQELDAACGEASADLVVSRAVLHWVPLDDHPDCYAAVRRVLRPGGWFHAESGGHGNVRRVEALLDDIAAGHGIGPATVDFPDPGTVMELLEQAGFHIPEDGVTTAAQRRSFDREQLVGFLRTQAVLAYLPQAPPGTHEPFLAEVADRADELRRHDGTYDQTFVRLHILCQRP
jgi:trans-aconitate methyltransferase